MNKYASKLPLLLAACLFSTAVQADVPPTMTYQGKVTVDDKPFEGPGRFKFSIVDGGTENVRSAEAEALVTNGFVTAVVITDEGSGYADPPRLTFSGGGGSGAEAVVEIEDGRVVSITLTSAGSGYSSPPDVSMDAPPPATIQTLWSHDGRSKGGEEPGSYMTLDVNDGVFSVVLGNDLMEPLHPDVFEMTPVFLRVWFDGRRGFEQLAPDFELTAIPYAHLAARAFSVADGVLTEDAFSGGAIGNALSAEGIGVWAESGGGLSTSQIVGIGTTSPAEALDVNGNIQVSGWIGSGNGDPFEIRLEDDPVLRIAPAGSDTAPRPNVTLGAPTNQITGASTQGSTVSGGSGNVASASEAVISGGTDNTASGGLATVGGGFGNTASHIRSTVGGGDNNTAEASEATVGGGRNNRASGIRATVAGGDGNVASGSRALVGGGLENIASGSTSVVPGGMDNVAAGSLSFAAGRRAQANHTGAFVWSDSSATPFASTDNNQFLVNASGGVGINTNNPSGAFHVVGGNAAIGDFDADDRLGVGTDNPWNTLHVVSNDEQGPFRVAVGNNNNTAFRVYPNRGTGIGGSWSDNAVPDRGLRVHGVSILSDQVAINHANPWSDSLLHLRRSGAGHRDLIFEASNARAWAVGNNGVAGWLTFAYAEDIADGFEGQSFISTNGSYNRFSDERLKHDIKPVDGFLEKILSLEPVSYRLIRGGADAENEYGFIAQQVQKLFPEIVNDHEEFEYLSLAYETFSVLAIQGIREQQEIIEDQAAEIIDLRLEMDALAEMAARNGELEQRLERIEDWLASQDNIGP